MLALYLGSSFDDCICRAKAGFHVAGKPFASRAAKGKALAWNDGARRYCMSGNGLDLVSSVRNFTYFDEADQ